MGGAHDLLTLLRNGPVPQAELTRRWGPYRPTALRELLRAQGHVIEWDYGPSGTLLRLVHDASDQQRLEGAA